MPRANKTSFAILGLLAWRPMSGYDIKKLIEIGLSYIWHESYGSLYPTLELLVRSGFATRREERRHGARRRHVYRITPKGRRALEAWLRAPTDLPRTRNEHQLKFFLSARRPLEESVRLLEEYRAQQLEVLELYADSERFLRDAVDASELPDEVLEVLPAADPPRTAVSRRREALVFLLTLRHGVRHVEARLAWCDEALAAVRAEMRERDDD